MELKLKMPFAHWRSFCFVLKVLNEDMAEGGTQSNLAGGSKHPAERKQNIFEGRGGGGGGGGGGCE